MKKKYNDAYRYYEKVIGINMVSYPAAYYNMALLNVQMNDYKNAILNMQKYLLIVPDAPDARAAQDKIYEWEIKLEH